jgi:pimeloyl-ACP methyl ester carboxylesterase
MRPPSLKRKSVRRAAVALAALVCALIPAVGTSAAAAAPGSIDWQPCGKHGVLCSSLRVPLDWAHPDGRQISVGLTELPPADPAHSRGVLFFNPGGPGGGTRQILREYADLWFPAAIRRNFEIVGVDPRGVSPSSPSIRCTLPLRDREITTTPSTKAGYLRLLGYERRVGRGCLRRTGPLLKHDDTVSAARDFDAVREALGVEKVSWFGVSYGTILGATYAHLFPSHVRAAVLDGAVDHTVGTTRLALDEARSANGEFGAFARWCADAEECALHGRDPAALFRSLLADAQQGPIPAKGIPGGATADNIGYGTYELLSMRHLWPRLAAGIAAATAPHPDASGLARFGAPQNASYRATTCLDFPSDIHGYSQFEALLGKLWRAAPITGPYVEGWQVAISCMAWPVPANNPWGPVPVSGTPPILVVGGTHDPATPEVWARGLARQIAGSRLLIWKGSGHTGYFNDAKVKALEVAYLLSPQAPVPGTIPG